MTAQKNEERSIFDLKKETNKRINKYIIDKALHAEAVRKSIAETLKIAEEVEIDGRKTTKIDAVEPIMKTMVVSASSELGGKLTDKEMKQLENIALRVIGEFLGEE